MKLTIVKLNRRADELRAEEGVESVINKELERIAQLEFDRNVFLALEEARILGQEKFIVAAVLLVACIAFLVYVTGYLSRAIIKKRWFIKNRFVPYLKLFLKIFFGSSKLDYFVR